MEPGQRELLSARESAHPNPPHWHSDLVIKQKEFVHPVLAEPNPNTGTAVEHWLFIMSGAIQENRRLML